jgi:hypothetical protein
MSHRNLVLGSVLLVIVVTLCVYGAFRLFAHFDCFEISVYSPSKLVATMDYVALGRWERRNCVVKLDIKGPGGDTLQWCLTEDIYRTISAAKGDFDSVAFWHLVPSVPEMTPESSDENDLVYGVQIASKGEAALDESDFALLTSDPEVAKALSVLAAVVEALQERRGKTIVLGKPDRGGLSFAYSINEICYYDEDGAPRSVSSKKYWRQVLSAAGKR